MWRITDQPLISCNCGLLLHLFSGMSTNNANFCHNNSSQLKCKKSWIKSSLVRKTATKKEANTLIEALWSWPWPGRLHICVLWIVSTWLFYSLTLRSLATVYFNPSLRQLSYCGTAQKKERKESESVGCAMWLILTSLLSVCTAKVTPIMDAVKAFKLFNRGCVYICPQVAFIFPQAAFIFLSRLRSPMTRHSGPTDARVAALKVPLAGPQTWSS